MKMMYVKLAAFAAAGVLSAGAPVAYAQGKSDGKGQGKSDGKGKGRELVDICHKGRTISVAPAALDAHLGHGDTLGPCEVTPVVGGPGKAR